MLNCKCKSICNCNCIFYSKCTHGTTPLINGNCYDNTCKNCFNNEIKKKECGKRDLMIKLMEHCNLLKWNNNCKTALIQLVGSITVAVMQWKSCVEYLAKYSENYMADGKE